jgi:hypothetical protein
MAVAERAAVVRPLEGRISRGVAALREVLLVFVAAAAMAAGSATLGWMGLALAAAAWLLLPLLPGSLRGLPLVAAVVTTGVLAALHAEAPWTLLMPQWHTPAQWAGSALLVGLLAGGAGLGLWTRQPATARTRGAPLAAAGLVGWAMMGGAWALGAEFEQGGTGVEGWLGAAVAAAGITLALSAAPRPASGVGAAGCLATVWFATAGLASLPMWWCTVLPLLLAVPLAARGWQLGPRAGLALGLGALLAVAAAVLGWPGLPEHPLDAAGGAAMLVVLFWYVASRTVAGR